jgi:ABC-2 type transport system permease protein|tara:strand:- start:55615 stop:56412 length:798 start_codon:yes stop_codon:yes gene_type:complete
MGHKMNKNFNQMTYIKAVLRANTLEALRAGMVSYIPALLMFVQNIMFLMIWVMFFAYADNLNGWTLREMMVLTGVVCTAFGLTSFLCGGGYILNQIIDRGELDKYLCRPGSVLISAVFSNCRVQGTGDMLTGVMIMCYVAQFNMVEWLFFLACVIAASVLFISMIIIVQSIGFWKTNSASLSDALFEFIIILSSMPQHGFPAVAKVIIFTVLPVGFMGLLPVMIYTQQSLALLVPLYGAAFLFAFIARSVFYKGLERYKSGNLCV